MSNRMGANQTKQLSSLTWIHIICKSSPLLPFSCILITNSMGPKQTKQLLYLIWVQAICESTPQLSGPMSNSMGPDQTKQLSNLDQGPTYL